MTDQTYSKIFLQLRDLAQALKDHFHIPGVGIGILHRGSTYTSGLGISNVNVPQDVDADTIFQIGSITKTLTALTIMRLVDQDLVDLDTPLREYLPELKLADPHVTRQATLRHILTHTGGWEGDYFDDTGPGDDALQRMIPRLEKLPQETPLGEIYSYNNAGFYIAGRLIELLTNKPFEIAVHDHLLNPLGMDHSSFFVEDLITHRIAVGHEAVYAGDERVPGILLPWGMPRASNAMGGLLSTVHDLLKYASFLMGNGMTPKGDQIVKPQTLRKMFTPGISAANGEKIGISWFLRYADRVLIARHGGATNGQMAMLQFVPDHQFAVAVLTNSDRGSEFYQAWVKQAMAHLLGIIESEPKPISASSGDYAELLGSYEASAQNLQLKFDHGELILQVNLKGGFPVPESPAPPSPPPVKMALCETDCLLALEEPFKGNRAEFLRGPDGRINWLRFSGRVHRRLN